MKNLFTDVILQSSSMDFISSGQPVVDASQRALVFRTRSDFKKIIAICSQAYKS
jgi:hypothetical protein